MSLIPWKLKLLFCRRAECLNTVIKIMTNWFKSHGTESLKDFCVFLRAINLVMNTYKWHHIMRLNGPMITELRTTSLVTKVMTDCKMLCMYWDQTDEQGESAESKVGKNIQETPSWKLSSRLTTGTFCFCKQNTVSRSLCQLKVTVYLWI